MSPIEHMRDLVGPRFACDPHFAASKDELWLCIPGIWNFLPHADIQCLFDFMSCRIEVLTAASDGYTKY